MAVLLFIKYQPYGTSAMLERRAYHVEGFLLCGIGMVDAATAEPLGMNEYKNVREQETNKKEITKLAKMMRKITLLLTVQGLGPVNEQCPSVNFDAVERQEHFGMWLVIFILLVLWFLCR